VTIQQLDRALCVGGVRMAVRDHDNRGARLGDVGQHAHHGIAVGCVEVAGRFVGQDELRCRNQRTRHGDALLLAARELLRQVACTMRQPDGPITAANSPCLSRLISLSATVSTSLVR
jgi:hypothetical protein